jgi:uncharacterized protein YecE (DUF72 family)
MTGRFYAGCAVWGHVPWVGDLYPKGTPQRAFLRAYGERLTAVEGNTTFHALPERATVARWAAELPDEFQFLPKLHKTISHDGDLAPKRALAEDFIDLMCTLGTRRGPFFLQLPPSYQPTQIADLTTFLDAWPREIGLAVEVRDIAWFRRDCLAQLDTTLAHFGAARVLLDTNPCYRASDNPMRGSSRVKPDLPVHPGLTADFAFVRYIGHPAPEQNETFLAQWAARVDTWLRDGVDVYFIVHCPIEDHSPSMVRRFHQLLTARGAPVAPLPWDSAPGQIALL